MTSIETNKRIVDRFDALLNTRDLDLLDELCTSDMVNHSLSQHRPIGLEGTRQYLNTNGKAFQTDRWRECIVVAEDDFVVQFGIREGCWPGGNFRGVALREGPYEREFAVMYRIAGERIAERWAVRDDFNMIINLSETRLSEQAS
jgi:predicted ester cyclase